MQGKVIAVAYTLRTYWGGICKQEKMDPPPPRDSTLQSKDACTSEITFLAL